MNYDLAEVVLVNENRPPETPGDVMVFRSAEDACLYLEPWWVNAGEGMALSLAGEKLVLSGSGSGVKVLRRESMPEGEQLVASWLMYVANALHAARNAGEQGAWVPSATADLVEYIGFSR